MSATDKQADKMAWGLALLLIGLLVLLDRTGVTRTLPWATILHSTGTYLLLAGIIFLIYMKEKTLGLILSLGGLLLHSNHLFGWISQYRNILLPIALLVVGLLLVWSGRKRR